jgi:uncharacterized phage protein gp47/JayE
LPFSRPTLPQIAARVKTDISTALDSTAAFFRRSFERGVQNAMSGVSHHLHGHVAWIALQLDPTSADDDMVEKLHGNPWGITKVAAVAAVITVTATGTNGTVVPATTTSYLRSDGTRFTVTTGGTVSGGTVTLTLTADEEGASGNTDAGEILTIESPIAGLSTTATVATRPTDGADQETPEAYLDRVLQRRRTPPRGGAVGDYEAWLLEVAGITRAWEYPRQEGPGTVTCYVVNDDDDPITVSAAKLIECAAHLNTATRQPTTVDCYVYTPTLQPINYTINITPNTAAVQTAITEQLQIMTDRVAHPGGMSVLLSEINEAISIAPGETNHATVSPAADVVVPFGSMASLGTITFGTLP